MQWVWTRESVATCSARFVHFGAYLPHVVIKARFRAPDVLCDTQRRGVPRCCQVGSVSRFRIHHGVHLMGSAVESGCLCSSVVGACLALHHAADETTLTSLTNARKSTNTTARSRSFPTKEQGRRRADYMGV